MNCERYESQINDYLDNKLNKIDKLNFEDYLNKNLEFKKIVEDIRNNDLLLKQIPDIKTKSDFILNLNQKIDLYEKSKFPFIKYNLIRQLFNKDNRIQLIGVFSFVFIVSFALFKISDLNLVSNFKNLSDRNNFDTSIAVNDTDSLNNIINDTPILLIGNEK